MPERDPIAELESEFQRWEFYMNGGGSDPSYTDGYNMNSIRRRIEWQQKAILDSCIDGNIPDICKRDIPSEMPGDFMAKADDIRYGARVALAAFHADKNYIWLKEHQNMITPKESNRICLENILWYADGLEKAIEKDDLLAMRIKCNFAHYLDSFSRCRREMEKIFAQRTTEPQLSLFSVGAPQAGLNFSDEDTDSDEGINDEAQEISM